ncbi:ATP-citrate synthase alpha chain protein 2-like protein [Tanacetum coccineum]
MARKKIREYDSKRLVKEHYKRISGNELVIKSAQGCLDMWFIGSVVVGRSDHDSDIEITKGVVTESTDLNELIEKEPWLSSSKLVVKPDMLFGKRGKSGLVALNLDLAQVAEFVKARLGKEVEMGGCKGPITTFIVEPFVPHNEEFYINIVSERLGCSISFSECGGIDIEENWDKVKTIFLPTGVSLNQEIVAPLVATLPLEVSFIISVARIALVKPEKARGVEDVILRAAQMGQIAEKVIILSRYMPFSSLMFSLMHELFMVSTE